MESWRKIVFWINFFPRIYERAVNVIRRKRFFTGMMALLTGLVIIIRIGLFVLVVLGSLAFGLYHDMILKSIHQFWEILRSEWSQEGLLVWSGLVWSDINTYNPISSSAYFLDEGYPSVSKPRIWYGQAQGKSWYTTDLTEHKTRSDLTLGREDRYPTCFLGIHISDLFYSALTFISNLLRYIYACGAFIFCKTEVIQQDQWLQEKQMNSITH